MDIGIRVKLLRKSLGMTQKDLAMKCGYKSLTTINKIELGINSVPLDAIERLATALDTTPAYLMGWADKAQENELISLIDKLNADEIKELSNYIDYILSKRK